VRNSKRRTGKAGVLDRSTLALVECAIRASVPRGGCLQIVVNGEARDVPENTSIADLLEALSVSPRGVAVEVNLQLVPRQQHAQHLLAAGDQIEVVTLVGGG